MIMCIYASSILCRESQQYGLYQVMLAGLQSSRCDGGVLESELLAEMKGGENVWNESCVLFFRKL